MSCLPSSDVIFKHDSDKMQNGNKFNVLFYYKTSDAVYIGEFLLEIFLYGTK